MDELKYDCPEDVDFNHVDDNLNDSSYFDRHSDSPLLKEREKKLKSKEVTEQKSDKPPQMSNVFSKLYSGNKDSKSVVHFAKASDHKVQQGIKFISSKPATVPKSPFLRTKYRTRNAKTDNTQKDFVAQPMPTFKYKEPEVLKRQIIPESPMLYTKQRAVKRNEFDEDLNQRRTEEKQAEDLHNQILINQEQQALKEERERRTFKAHKMPTYNPPKIEKSKIPLTHPKSPSFSNKQRKDSSFDHSLEELHSEDRELIKVRLGSIKSALNDLKLKNNK